MNIQQLQYMCAVSRYGSMTTAAQKLFVTQQTVSKSICKLEKELGYQLLTRNHNGVSITDSGKVFVEKSEKILADIRGLYNIETSNSLSAATNETMSLFCSDYFIYRVAPELIVYFKQHFPNVRLHIEEHFAKDIVSLVEEENNLGYITVFDDKLGCTEACEHLNQLDSLNVYDDEICIICSKDHPLAKQEKACLLELDKYTFVLAAIPGLEDVLRRDYGVALNVLMYSSNFASVLETVSSGIAIGFATSSVMATSKVPDEIKIIPISQKPRARNYFVYPKDHQLSPLEREVIKQSSRILSNL